MPPKNQKPNVEESDFLFGPILSKEKELKSHYRICKSSFDFKSIHPADAEEYESKGWQIQRAGKKSTRIKKEKSHSDHLEDRIWCLLYQMGYRQLSCERSIIKFQREDGTNGQKQYDVFACDEETAIVIECKSRAENGRRSLRRDIEDTIQLQNILRKSIFTIYQSRPNPKIIWAYVTRNIIWSERDIGLADSKGIAILTENELQYFEAFIKHMGPAGRYQILGEFLKDQKVPGLGDVRVPAVRGKLGGEVFYSFVATPRRLLKISFINHQALNHPDGRPAYQRMISSNRIKQISQFIREGGYFPTNVIVNFTDKPRFDLLPNKDNSDPNIKFGWVTLPSKYRSAWVIDGQHRLFGYSHLPDEYLDQSLLVIAFEKMDIRKEADLFITINHKQKSVPAGLLVSLLADIRMGDPDPKTAVKALGSAVIRSLNTDRSSPLSRRFAIPDVPPEPKQNLTISEAVNGLTRSGLLGYVVKKSRVQGPMCGSTDAETIERSRIILNGYFENLRLANPLRWETGKASYVSVNPGIRAHLMLIGEIIKYLEKKHDIEFISLGESKFINKISKIANPVFDYIRDASDSDIREQFSRKFGEAGVREYHHNLCKIIHDRFEDFGNEEFRRYMSQRASTQVQEAHNLVLDLSELMTNYIVDTLRQVYGTNSLDSGEAAYWELGIESRKIKENAYKKQLDDRGDRRKRKEAYLDILDLKAIIEQKNNWNYFSHIFDQPLPGERKGKAKYTSWVGKFNELRRIPAHPSALKTYTDDDFEFVDWLRSGPHRRLKEAIEIESDG